MYSYLLLTEPAANNEPIVTGPESESDAIFPVANGWLTRLAQVKLDRPILVELKNGKVFFRQKSVSFEKQSETLQGTLRVCCVTYYVLIAE